MDFQKFESLISPSRISRYLSAARHDQQKAIELYKANLKVAQAFHPLLGLCEISLRNKLDSVLSSHFTTTDWIISEVNGFMAHSSLTKYDHKLKKNIPDHWLKKNVEKSIARLNSTHTPVSVGKVIAEQTFGFWTELFEIKYYRLLLGVPIQVFSGLPPNYGRKEISRDLTYIRKLRNRINHNEPICFNSQDSLDFSHTLDVYTAIKNILGWIDNDLIHFSQQIDSVNTSVQAANLILQ